MKGPKTQAGAPNEPDGSVSSTGAGNFPTFPGNAIPFPSQSPQLTPRDEDFEGGDTRVSSEEESDEQPVSRRRVNRMVKTPEPVVSPCVTAKTSEEGGEEEGGGEEEEQSQPDSIASEDSMGCTPNTRAAVNLKMEENARRYGYEPKLTQDICLYGVPRTYTGGHRIAKRNCLPVCLQNEQDGAPTLASDTSNIFVARSKTQTESVCLCVVPAKFQQRLHISSWFV